MLTCHLRWRGASSFRHVGDTVTGRGRTSRFWEGKRRHRTRPAPATSQWPSARNNLMPKWHILGLAYPDPLWFRLCTLVLHTLLFLCLHTHTQIKKPSFPSVLCAKPSRQTGTRWQNDTVPATPGERDLFQPPLQILTCPPRRPRHQGAGRGGRVRQRILAQLCVRATAEWNSGLPSLEREAPSGPDLADSWATCSHTQKGWPGSLVRARPHGLQLTGTSGQLRDGRRGELGLLAGQVVWEGVERHRVRDGPGLPCT